MVVQSRLTRCPLHCFPPRRERHVHQLLRMAHGLYPVMVEHPLLAELLFSPEPGKCALLRWINFARRIPSGLCMELGDESYSRIGHKPFSYAFLVTGVPEVAIQFGEIFGLCAL
jgi:hypothetical protein